MAAVVSSSSARNQVKTVGARVTPSRANAVPSAGRDATTKPLAASKPRTPVTSEDDSSGAPFDPPANRLAAARSGGRT